MPENTLTESAFRATQKKERERKRTAIANFVAAAEAGNEALFRAAWIECDLLPSGVRDAMRAIARRDVAETIQASFLQYWIDEGDCIRDSVNDDRALIAAMQRLLPPYRGPAITLYRGDSWFNRRRRSYGLAWTSSLATAEGFAKGTWQTFTGGSVVLESLVPAEAIMCAPVHHDNRFEEDEYLVDRRKLGAVKVLRRLPQRPVEYGNPGT